MLKIIQPQKGSVIMCKLCKHGVEKRVSSLQRFPQISAGNPTCLPKKHSANSIGTATTDEEMQEGGGEEEEEEGGEGGGSEGEGSEEEEGGEGGGGRHN